MISSYLIKNAKIVNELVLRDHFQRHIDHLALSNKEAIAVKQQECDRNLKKLFSNWRKIKQEKYVRNKIRKAEKMEVKKKERKEMS